MFWQKKINPQQQKVVDKLKTVLGVDEFRQLETLMKSEMSKPPKVAIIGKAGVGKSSTVNALFSLDEKVSHVDHGTTEATQREVDLPDGGGLSIIDMPGLGSDIELDEKYMEIYRQVLPTSDIVLYIMQANVRGINEDEVILRDLVQGVMGNLKGKLVIGLNQVDKMRPGEWNEKFNFPSPEQENNINRRCQEIQKQISDTLSIKVEQVEYYSAVKRYRLYNLLAAVIKSSGAVGWKFSLDPADPVELADESVRSLLRGS
jgi:uncharacterized protein